MTTDGREIWASYAWGHKTLGVSPLVFRRLIGDGVLTSLRVPGARPKVKRADVERLLAESTRPAVDRPMAASR